MNRLGLPRDIFCVGTVKETFFCTEGLMISNITKLSIGGASDVFIDNDGTVRGAKDYRVDDTELLLNESQSGSNVVIGNNGAMVIGSGSVSVINRGSVSGNIITINGKRVNLDNLPEAQEEPDKELTLDKNCKINTIVISGTGSVRSLPTEGFLSDRLRLRIHGQSDVVLPTRKFNSLDIHVSGQGDVEGSPGTETDVITVSLSGMGNVEDIHVLQEGDVSVSGMGHVQLTAKNPKNVHKQVSGMGSATIKRK